MASDTDIIQIDETEILPQTAKSLTAHWPAAGSRHAFSSRSVEELAAKEEEEADKAERAAAVPSSMPGGASRRRRSSRE